MCYNLNRNFDLQNVLDKCLKKIEALVINVQKEIDRIAALDDSRLANEIYDNVWWIVSVDKIVWASNISAIREAYIDFMTAWDQIEFLQAKWKLIAMANWWEAKSMSLSEIQSMFQHWKFVDVYKNMFFAGQDIPEKNGRRGGASCSRRKAHRP